MIPFVLILTGISLLYAAAGSAATGLLSFAGEALTRVNGVEVKEQIYVAPGMMRRELDVGHGHQIEITRWDKKLAWLLMTDDQLYLERPLNPGEEQNPYTASLDRSPIGQEMVNGIKTTKFQTAQRQADGTMFTGFVWASEEGVTVKLDLKSSADPPVTVQMELTNLRIGKQDAKLFELPKGYRRFSLGGGDGGRPDR
jgi:hypothetical protein